MILNDNFNKKNSFSNNNFSTKMDLIKENHQNTQNKINPFVDDFSNKQYIDPTNKQSMKEKTLTLLNERLKQGHISIDDFNRECEKLNKLN